MGAQMQCPHCGQVYGLTDEQVPQYAGQTITCTKCQKSFTVPTNTGMVAPPPLAGGVPGPPVAGVGYGLPQSQYAAVQKTNGMAIASVVCGAIGFIIPVIPAILGIIFGILGLRRTRDPAVGGKSLSIVGLSLSGATFLILPCLISILLPGLNRARETANRVKCAANMKSIGQALLLYANENRGVYPPRLEVLAKEEDVSLDIFVCPSSNDEKAPDIDHLSSGGHLSYVYVGQKLNPNSTSEAVLLYEPILDHGNDGSNFLFADGHVAFYARPAAQTIISQLQTGINPPRASNMR